MHNSRAVIQSQIDWRNFVLATERTDCCRLTDFWAILYDSASIQKVAAHLTKLLAHR